MNSEIEQKCPMCSLCYAAMRQHLMKAHKVCNRVELRLILKASNGRVAEPLICTICNEKKVRLDKHLLSSHKDLTSASRADLFRCSKKEWVLGQLRLLRASNPSPPMVSYLDIRPEDLAREDQEVARTVSLLSAAPSAAPAAEPAATATQPACHGCRIREAENAKLRGTVAILMGRERMHRPPRRRFQRAEEDLCMAKPGFEELMDLFYERELGAKSGLKDQDNCKQRVANIREFVILCCDGVPQKSLTALKEERRLTVAVGKLKEKGLAPTTIKKKMVDVTVFFKWLKRASPVRVRLSQKVLGCLIDQIRKHQKDLARDVVRHQQRVRRRKTANLLKAADHSQFIDLASRKLPLYLSRLEKSLEDRDLQMFFGLLAGLMVTTSGHRINTIRNLTVQEVEEAVHVWGDTYILYIKSHKTRGTFGDAKVALQAQEYGVMVKAMESRDCFPGGMSNHYFFNQSGKQSRTLLAAFQAVWKEIGMKEPAPSFVGMRSSMATHAHRALPAEAATAVSEAMCHYTAVRFYAANHSPEKTSN